MKKPYITESDDGSIMIEFHKKDRRFCICLEKNLSESSWNYVSYHDVMECEELPENMIKFLKEFDEG